MVSDARALEWPRSRTPQHDGAREIGPSSSSPGASPHAPDTQWSHDRWISGSTDVHTSCEEVAVSWNRNSRKWATAVLSCAVAVAPSTVFAQSVPYAGYTNGCFGAACTPGTADVFTTAMLGGLTYQNADFGGTTIAGFAAIGNVQHGLGTMEVDNLGALYLDSSVFDYNGSMFHLAVTFTLPGSVNAMYTANLSGKVSSNQGGVFLDFDNTAQTFAWVGTTTTGTLALSVNDASIIAPTGTGITAIQLSGNLFITQQGGGPGGGSITPEPATLALLAPGLLGVVGVLRRRRSKTA
jgi:hypothetical protein